MSNPFMKVLVEQVKLATDLLKSIKTDTEYYSKVSKEAYPGKLEVSAGIQALCYAYQDTHTKACKQVEKAKGTLAALKDHPYAKPTDIARASKLIRHLSAMVTSTNRRIETVTEALRFRENNPAETSLPVKTRVKKTHEPFLGYHTSVGGGSFLGSEVAVPVSAVASGDDLARGRQLISEGTAVKNEVAPGLLKQVVNLVTLKGNPTDTDRVNELPGAVGQIGSGSTIVKQVAQKEAALGAPKTVVAALQKEGQDAVKVGVKAQRSLDKAERNVAMAMAANPSPDVELAGIALLLDQSNAALLKMAQLLETMDNPGAVRETEKLFVQFKKLRHQMELVDANLATTDELTLNNLSDDVRKLTESLEAMKPLFRAHADEVQAEMDKAAQRAVLATSADPEIKTALLSDLDAMTEKAHADISVLLEEIADLNGTAPRSTDVRNVTAELATLQTAYNEVGATVEKMIAAASPIDQLHAARASVQALATQIGTLRIKVGRVIDAVESEPRHVMAPQAQSTVLAANRRMTDYAHIAEILHSATGLNVDLAALLPADVPAIQAAVQEVNETRDSIQADFDALVSQAPIGADIDNARAWQQLDAEAGALDGMVRNLATIYGDARKRATTPTPMPTPPPTPVQPVQPVQVLHSLPPVAATQAQQLYLPQHPIVPPPTTDGAMNAVDGAEVVKMRARRRHFADALDAMVVSDIIHKQYGSLKDTLTKMAQLLRTSLVDDQFLFVSRNSEEDVKLIESTKTVFASFLNLALENPSIQSDSAFYRTLKAIQAEVYPPKASPEFKYWEAFYARASRDFKVAFPFWFWNGGSGWFYDAASRSHTYLVDRTQYGESYQYEAPDSSLVFGPKGVGTGETTHLTFPQ